MKHTFISFAANYTGEQILRHTFAIGWNKHSAGLNSALSEHYDANRTVLYATGRAALSAAVRALCPPGSGVAIPGLTCHAVPTAVTSADCIPIYLDISSKTYNSEAKNLADTLKTHKNIKAIIIQNHLGIPTDIAAIEAICQKHNISIIEDLAHCAGAHYPDGREIGTVGSAVALSFGKGKALDTVRGGALILRQKPVRTIKEPAKLPTLPNRLRDRFYPLLGRLTRSLYYIKLGKPFTSFIFKAHLASRSADGPVDLSCRLTHWQAALALEQFDSLAQTSKHRTLTAAKIITKLKLPPIRKGSAPLRVPLLVADRPALLATLESHNIHFDDIWYDVPVSPKRLYGRLGFPEADCPVAVATSEQLVNIPTFLPLEELAPALKIIKKDL